MSQIFPLQGSEMDEKKKAKKDLFWETGLFLTQVLAVSIAVAAVIGFGHAETFASVSR
jgi:hypothetical protein